jgi:uncharacterized protein
MKTCFIDTNLFVRYLTDDDPEKANRVDRLLAEARSGKIELVTAEMVIAELVWVLESAYGLKSIEITPMVKGILATPGIKVTNSSVLTRALEYYEYNNIDFIDGYIAAMMEKLEISELYSFDKKHIPRINRIKRIEP